LIEKAEARLNIGMEKRRTARRIEQHIVVGPAHPAAQRPEEIGRRRIGLLAQLLVLPPEERKIVLLLAPPENLTDVNPGLARHRRRIRPRHQRRRNNPFLFGLRPSPALHRRDHLDPTFRNRTIPRAFFASLRCSTVKGGLSEIAASITNENASG
jgi:hypothetical protein